MTDNNDCGCRASKDIDRLQNLFGVKSDKRKSLPRRVLDTTIRFAGVVTLVFLSFFAIPFVLHNAMENKKRTGKPFVSLPSMLKTPMKHVVNSYAKSGNIKKTETTTEDGR